MDEDRKDFIIVSLIICFIMLLFFSVSFLVINTLNEVDEVRANKLMLAYENSETINYNPLTKTYSFDNYTNITKGMLLNNSFIYNGEVK